MSMMQEITSLQNPIVKHLTKLRKDRKYRRESGTVVIEGIKLVSEVCQEVEALKIVTTDEKFIPHGLRAKEIYHVNASILEKISGVQTPEGILAEVPIPSESLLDESRFIVAFDGVSDPGNLGTLLRTALALGWDGAYLLDTSCDPYNDKAIRAAKGAVFRLPIQFGNWKTLKHLVQKNKLKPIAADIQGKDLEQVSIDNGVLLVLGNEAQGLSDKARQFCETVTIAMSGKMESLNVSIAGGIIMYAIKNQ